MSTPGQTAFKLSFQASPIILSGGLAQNIPGGLLPIIAITEAVNFPLGLLSGGSPALDNLDDLFATWQVLPGGTLIKNEVGRYPFANQTVAANAIIADPLRVSMIMICPVRESGGYGAKLATMTALQAAVAQHINLGGTFTVATPSFLYTDCLLLDVTDVSGAESKQVQTRWRWDFERPLLALSSAQQALNTMMNRVAGGLPTDGSLSGPFNSVNFPPSLASTSTVGSASGLAGAGVAGQ